MYLAQMRRAAFMGKKAWKTLWKEVLRKTATEITPVQHVEEPLYGQQEQSSTEAESREKKQSKLQICLLRKMAYEAWEES